MVDKKLEDAIGRISEEDVKRATRQSKRARHKANRGVLKQLVDKINEMGCLLRDYSSGKYRAVPGWTVAACALTILYIVNPQDMIPDYILGVGYVDDGFLSAVVLSMIEQDLKAWRHWRKLYEEEEKRRKKAEKKTKE